MSSLRDLQRDVMRALADGLPERAIRHVAGPADRARARLDLYRNTRRQNFGDALESTYPAVARLVGKDYFRQTVQEFQRRHPSRSGDLAHAGRGFADHMAELHANDEFACLADVARLEWLIQECLLEAEHPPLDLDALRSVPPERYDGLRFILHPTLRVFESRFPARHIREVNVSSDAEPPTIRLDEGGDRVAILRRRLQLEFHDLTVGERRFLGALARGDAFASAIEQASCADFFDAAATLRRFVAAAAIVDFV